MNKQLSFDTLSGLHSTFDASLVDNEENGGTKQENPW